MKKKFFYFLFILYIILNLSFFDVFGQSSSSGIAGSPNAPVTGTDYLGWASGAYPTVGSLDIRTNDAINPIPIDYWTQYKARFQVYENPINAADPLAGNIAIGDFTTFQPQSLVHQHNNGLVLPYYDTYHQFTNINTGYFDGTGAKPFNYTESKCTKSFCRANINYLFHSGQCKESSDIFLRQ